MGGRVGRQRAGFSGRSRGGGVVGAETFDSPVAWCHSGAARSCSSSRLRRIASSALGVRMDAVASRPTSEYRDLVVRLDLRCPANAGDTADQRVLQEYEGCVQAALWQAASDRWEPDGSIDPETMWSTGRLEGRTEAWSLVFDAVTIPL